MSWLDKSVNNNKGIEMIGGISWYEKELQRKRSSLQKDWDQLTKIHEPLKDRDGNPIGELLIFGTGEDIEEGRSVVKEFFNNPDSYNIAPFKQWYESDTNPYSPYNKPDVKLITGIKGDE